MNGASGSNVVERSGSATTRKDDDPFQWSMSGVGRDIRGHRVIERASRRHAFSAKESTPGGLSKLQANVVPFATNLTTIAFGHVDVPGRRRDHDGALRLLWVGRVAEQIRANSRTGSHAGHHAGNGEEEGIFFMMNSGKSRAVPSRLRESAAREALRATSC